jgi:hypothetical protein
MTEKNIIQITFILLKKAHAVVQKTSRQNVTSTVVIFSSFLAGFNNKGVRWLYRRAAFPVRVDII